MEVNMKILVVVDMQNDFIDGALGTPEAVAIVPYVRERVKNFDGKVIFTRDTHFENYLATEEGRRLPVPHCIKGTHGWQISDELLPFCTEVIDKLTFGSSELISRLGEYGDAPESITLLGLCTDICVISNALLIKAFYPEVPIAVDSRGCAGVSPESHTNALMAMKTCQIDII